MLGLMETAVGQRLREIRAAHKRIRDAKKPKPNPKTREWTAWTTAELKMAIALRAECPSWRIVAKRLGTGRKPGAIRVAVFRYRKSIDC